MTTYKITSPAFVAGIIVGGDIVVQAPPVLGWSVGVSFISVRDYCKKRGWIIEPVADSIKPTMIELDGRVYEIRYRSNNIESIVLYEDGEERELSWSEVPEILKEQL